MGKGDALMPLIGGDNTMKRKKKKHEPTRPERLARLAHGYIDMMEIEDVSFSYSETNPVITLRIMGYPLPR